ncbi:MAG: hypothetical protein ACREDC_00155 [Bradyrhizobium sp.]
MTDPSAVAMQQAFQAFRVRMETGDGFRNAQGYYSPAVLLESPEYGDLERIADDFAKAEGLPPFGASS